MEAVDDKFVRYAIMAQETAVLAVAAADKADKVDKVAMEEEVPLGSI